MIEAGFLLAVGIVAGLAVLAVLAVAGAFVLTVATAVLGVTGATLAVIAQRTWPVLLLAAVAAIVYWWEHAGPVVIVAGILIAPGLLARLGDRGIRRAWAALKARRSARIAP